MPQSVNIQYTGYTPKMKRSEQNAILRESYTDLGQHFINTNLPRRFTVQGARMLGYTQRSPGYQKRKKRLFGHQLPLVFTGRTRQRALSSLTRIAARATKGQGRLELRLSVPALNLRNRGANLREQFERIADREIGPLERKLEQSASHRFEQYNQTQTFKG